MTAELPHRNVAIREQIYLYLKGEILSGHFPSGMRIIESELTEKLKVSRTPLREALVQLVSEGHLEQLSPKGLVVSNITPQKVADVYQIRTCLESEAIKLTTPCIYNNSELTKEMQELAAPFREFQKLFDSTEASNETQETLISDVLKDYEEANIKFHMFFNNNCPNRYYTKYLNDLYEMVQRFKHVSFLSYSSDIWSVSNKEHLCIVEAILRNDGDAASDLIRQHINRRINTADFIL